jgi:hypothetical protein
MKIEMKEVSIRELVSGFEDNNDHGVKGYGGLLNIRPPYQREFVYKDKQRDAVIDTITKNFPLNVMYWAACEDETFEVIDGQQRTISICQFVDGEFAFNDRYFHNLQSDEKEKILNYKLMIYVCSGTDSQKLDWFRTINIAGERLTDQELRNAVYAGSWLSDAKRYFSKPNCAAYGIGENYLNGTPIRQDYLEAVLAWISKDNIEAYMAKQQHKPNANELWLYFQSVINWVNATFVNYRKPMKGIDWGSLYSEFKDAELDSAQLETEVASLMEDEDVTNKKGIYAYVLTRKEKHLNIRAFSENQKREAYERQKGICTVCSKHFKIDQMEADHITPWHAGGKTSSENCQMLCKEDNRRKSGV